MVPALNSEDSSPRLRLVTAENMTVEFIVDVPEQNKKCQVGRFMQQTDLVFFFMYLFLNNLLTEVLTEFALVSFNSFMSINMSL